MREIFDANFVGLQIDWRDDQEIEYLGPAALAGASSQTAATCKWRGRPFHYLYPVIAQRSADQLILSYEDDPSGWPPRGWEVAKGRLTIDFHGRPQIPIRVSFWHKEDDTTADLLEGRDWVYQSSSPSSDLPLATRGKIKITRFDRSQQSALRNKLLSEHGECQISGARCAATLEACHIIPVKNKGIDSVENALLLRRDLHALFDASLLRFHFADGSWKIHIDESVDDPFYRQLHDTLLAKKLAPESYRYLIARAQLKG